MILKIDNNNLLYAPVETNGDLPRRQVDDEIIVKANRVKYLDNNYRVPKMIEMLSEGEYKQIDLFPEYQRRLIWVVEQQSALVESLLLGIPIPSVFLFEKGEDDYEVIDGLQRLNTIRGFRNNEFKLSGLNALRSLEGLTYENCNLDIKNRFDKSVIPAKILTMEPSNGHGLLGGFVETDIRRFIFSRINRGGTQLNFQQLRNAVYKGHFNDAVNELSKIDNFRNAFDIPLEIDKKSNLMVKMTQGNSRFYYEMLDCEMVLRFFALRSRTQSGKIEEILDETMEREKVTDINSVNQLKDVFLSRLGFLMELFDGRPFDIRYSHREDRKISTELYVDFMLGIDRMWEEREAVMQRKVKIKEAKNHYIYTDEAVSERLKSDSSDDYLVPSGDNLASQILKSS